MHCRLMQDCFMRPGPPNFFMSLQKWQSPQSARRQASHFLQRVRRRLAPFLSLSEPRPPPLDECLPDGGPPTRGLLFFCTEDGPLNTFRPMGQGQTLSTDKRTGLSVTASSGSSCLCSFTRRYRKRQAMASGSRTRSGTNFLLAGSF
ncbi:unnamed protein product, partial [Ixodes pacificus]